MGGAIISVRGQASQMMKTYAATSKQSTKTEGLEKLRDQLEAAGATVKYTMKEGFVVEMTRVQRSYFMRKHRDAHLADLTTKEA